ncbi:MAG TPA: hypothetical protein VK636_07020 [Gemmatimonadaceae bacterium]|nr:hypothetical protein [Gemmatimonadaceae bacterium]
MKWSHVTLEAHGSSATIYFAGLLADGATARATALLVDLPRDTRMLRVDLRSVQCIDSREFVSLARVLAPWRDGRRGRLTIEFPMASANSGARAMKLAV